MAINLPGVSTFDAAYEGRFPPWDIPGPQPALVDVADHITGRLLDSGCGTGENAMFFAQRGCEVTGIDFATEAIRRAQQKASLRGTGVTFLVKDALTLSDWNGQFDNIIDSGVFHVFSDEDAELYVKGLSHVLKPGGRLYLICFSDAEPGTQGPRRISKQILLDRFREGWNIESITPSRYNVRLEFDGSLFTEGGPKAWFVVVQRTVD